MDFAIGELISRGFTGRYTLSTARVSLVAIEVKQTHRSRVSLRAGPLFSTYSDEKNARGAHWRSAPALHLLANAPGEWNDCPESQLVQMLDPS